MKPSNGNNHVSLTGDRPSASALKNIMGLWLWSIRMLLRKRGTIYNFSEIETSPDGSIEIQKLVSEAGQAAASEAKAVGIPKVFAKNGQILKQYADGRIEVVAEADGVSQKAFFRQIKSEILHARKK